MPTTAFGRAMLAELQTPGVNFWLTWQFGEYQRARPLRFEARCNDFVPLRPEEVSLLQTLDLSPAPRVLDVGCGIGRHLQWVRRARPAAHLVGVEQCPGMRAYCQQAVAQPAQWFEGLDDALNLADHGGFDAILLMGNGLGIGGVQANCEVMLARLAAALAPGGVLVIESMPPPTGERDYVHAMTTVEAYGQTDGPFPWGFATSPWLASRLRRIRLQTEILANDAPGPGVYFAVASLS